MNTMQHCFECVEILRYQMAGSHIYKHIVELTNMCANWDWKTCLVWSEKVFAMINDGRLEQGWLDKIQIEDIQRDVCAIANREVVCKKNQNPITYKEFNPDIDGKPSKSWNWNKDCDLTSSHGTLLDR